MPNIASDRLWTLNFDRQMSVLGTYVGSIDRGVLQNLLNMRYERLVRKP
jgi:hypothetical protein